MKKIVGLAMIIVCMVSLTSCSGKLRREEFAWMGGNKWVSVDTLEFYEYSTDITKSMQKTYYAILDDNNTPDDTSDDEILALY